MAELVVDTDVLIDHLRGHRAFTAGRHRVSYSVVTRAELYAGESTDEQIVDRLLAPFHEIPVDRDIAEAAGRIRRRLGIRMPDAIIAATALSRRAQLVTRNRRDFEKVPRLTIRSS